MRSSSCRALSLMLNRFLTQWSPRPRCLHLALERREARRWRIEPGELREAHLVERPADGEVQPLPDAPDPAGRLDLALTMSYRAVGERDRALERIENRRGADLCGGPRQLVAAMEPARRSDEPGALQLFQQLAHRRCSDAGLLRE